MSNNNSAKTSTAKRKPVVLMSMGAQERKGHDYQVMTHKYIVPLVEIAGCLPLLVPTCCGTDDLEQYLDMADGVYLTGAGSNIDPALYGQDIPDAPGPFDAARDTMTADLIKAMLDLGKPVFGVCRGFQEINVAFGGTLRRDMASGEAPVPHHAPDDVHFNAMFDHEHRVDLTPGGVLATAFGVEAATVNSVHYQGVDRLGDGLAVEAVAPDGVVEAVSATVNDASVLAVQWHPEWRTELNPQSQVFFQLFGRALRGEGLRPPA